jgi:hypothetical protein
MKPGNLVPPAWAQLLVPRFACGHEKTPANSYQAGEFARCKACHDGKRKNINKINGLSAGRRPRAAGCAASR